MNRSSASIQTSIPQDALARRAFLANLRHELRTPINAIIGYSEMMIEDTAAEAAAGHTLHPDLQRVLVAGQELLALVNDTLDPKKIEAGEFDANLDEFGACLRHELRTPVNAIVGYSEMMLEIAPEIESDAFAPDLEKILAAARKFLDLINDVVNFSTISDQLAAGQLTLELQTPATASLLEEALEETLTTVKTLETKSQADEPELQGNILVVDDNAINRDILTRYLERLNHMAVAAEGGEQALEMLSEWKFDLVLLDVMMPGMNGYQVLEHIKQDEVLRDIPVIMISALDEVDSVVRCIEMGAEDYLPKPFNPVLLKGRLDASLEKKRLRDKEIEYLRQVARVTAAAAAVEADRFAVHDLDVVADRSDELGQLARVFQRMAQEVQAREQRLKQQVIELRIQVDEAKKAREVAEITETDYFQQLQAKAKRLRERG